MGVAQTSQQSHRMGIRKNSKVTPLEDDSTVHESSFVGQNEQQRRSSSGHNQLRRKSIFEQNGQRRKSSLGQNEQGRKSSLGQNGQKRKNSLGQNEQGRSSLGHEQGRKFLEGRWKISLAGEQHIQVANKFEFRKSLAGEQHIQVAQKRFLPNVFAQIKTQESTMQSTSAYPPPTPPNRRRDAVFKNHKYVALDNYVSKLPLTELYGDFNDVARLLTETSRSDIEKVRALFAWTTSIDINTLERSLEKLPNPGSPLNYLLRINSKIGNHPHFFAKLCRSADIPTIIVNGMTKNVKYEIGKQVDRSTMAAQWNAVYVAGEWRLIDVFWGCQCIADPNSMRWEEICRPGDDEDNFIDDKRKFFRNDAYFLTEPQELVYTHFPDDSKWQLLSEPVTQEQFERWPPIRERFHQLGMKLLDRSKQECVVKTEAGEIDFVFWLPDYKSKNLQFRYSLFKDVGITGIPLDQFVFYQKFTAIMKYSLSFPVAGRFKFHIYGVDDRQDANYDLCVAYVIDCDDPIKTAVPLPDVPGIGWGPGIEAETIGLRSTTHGEEAVIATTDGAVEIRFDMSNPLTVMQNVKSNDMDELLLSEYAMVRVENAELVLNLRFPKKGDYALNIHGAEEEVEGDIPNVCNYLIKCQRDNALIPFPKLHDAGLGKGMFAEDYHVFPKSHLENVLETKTEKLRIEFNVNESSKESKEILCELQNNDVGGKKLAGCVSFSKTGEAHVFELALPEVGEYAMNVYAKKEDDPVSLQHIHTYMITYTLHTSPPASASCVMSRQNIDSDSDQMQVITLKVKGNSTIICVPASDNPHLIAFAKKNAKRKPKPNDIKSKRVGGQDILKVNLPTTGDYKLDVFERCDSALVQVALYRIIRLDIEVEEELDEPGKDFDPAEVVKQENLEDELAEKKDKAKISWLRKQKINAARDSKDCAQLEAIIKDIEDRGFDKMAGAELKNLKKEALAMAINKELADAVDARDLMKLNTVIEQVENKDMQAYIGLQYQHATKTRDQLSKLEYAQCQAINVDIGFIEDILLFSKPPQAMHFAMSALYIVLGENEKQLRDWRFILILVGKTGEMSLQNRIAEFKTEDLDIVSAKKARVMLHNLTYPTIHLTSEGAAYMFLWAYASVEDRVARFEQSGGDMAEVQITKGKKLARKATH